MSVLKSVLCCFCCCLATLSAVTNSQQQSNSFDWKLVKSVLANSRANAVVSPFSIKLLLALLYEGTDSGKSSPTARQLEQIFGHAPSQNEKNSFTNVLRMKRSQAYNLNIGTKIYVDNSFQLNEQYNQLIKSRYDAEIEAINFKDLRRSAVAINLWSSGATQGHITNLVDESTIRNTIMLMLNAVFFKGLWSLPFPESNSQPKTFYVNRNTQISTPFMEQTAYFEYSEKNNLNSKVLRMHYEGDEISMILILPNENSNLRDLMMKINENSLSEVSERMHEVEVTVSIPKFKMNFALNLNDALQSMGIREIFTDSASLPLLEADERRSNRLKVSSIFQKVGIVVDEKGSTAYGASGAQLVDKFGGGSKKYFNANRPFLFIIEDSSSRTLLFVGKIENPLDQGRQ